jgi:hypothetical protein
MPAKERLKGLSMDELLDALSPESQEELAERLKNRASRKGPGGSGPERGEGKA